LSFITEHWQGRHETRQAFTLGVHHGLFCVGCCWSLMLLMFAIGAGSLGWMLVLGAVMAAEKNLPWGDQMSKPLGLALLIGGVAILIFGAA
jgi:predicted metal-binding membrane protein